MVPTESSVTMQSLKGTIPLTGIIYSRWLDYMYVTPAHPGRYCAHHLMLLNPAYPSKLSFTDWAIVEASSEDLPVLRLSLHDLKKK